MTHVVIIPAAGDGVRFRELGKFYPKCLLPYKNKPVISHLINKIEQDLSPDKIIVCIKPEHKHIDIWKVLPDTVQLSMVCPTIPQGPASSIASAFSLLEFDEDYRVTIVLSDMVLAEGFEFPGPNKLSVYKDCDSPERWCFFGPEGFANKPKKIPNNSKALCGVYSFSSGKLLGEAFSEQYVHSQEISDALEKYPVSLSPQEIDNSTLVDLGTLEEFLCVEESSKCRTFNKVSVDTFCVTKSSESRPQKISKEKDWLNNPPSPFLYRTPKIYPSSEGYKMERLFGRNLRNMFLYYDRDLSCWKDIFSDVFSVLLNCKERTTTGKERFWEMTMFRFQERSEFLLSGLVREIRKGVESIQFDSSPYHGDLHLSNMFWQESGFFKVVDPRGEREGHWLYDLSKLTHSIIGRYDLIEERLFSEDGDTVTYYERGLDSLRRMFLDLVAYPLLENVISLETLYLITSGLFGSMIPLHKGEGIEHLLVAECNRLALMGNYCLHEKSLEELRKLNEAQE